MMNGFLLYSILFIIINFSNTLGEIFLTQDSTYSAVNINVPLKVLKEAFHPTQLGKASATVVLPIHVNNDQSEEDVQDETENETVENLVQVVGNSTAVEDIPVSITDSDVQLSNNTLEEPVNGQGVRFPCKCSNGQCGCCSNMNLQWFKSNACGNITFEPEDFVFDVRLSVNNNTVVHRRVSASDPPPICFNPRRAPFVRICVELSNIRIQNRNAFACLDITADIAEFPIYSTSFRCFGLGASGVQSNLKPKPPSKGPTPVSLYGNNEDRGSLIENAASAVFGGDENGDGLFGGPSGGLLFGGDDDDDDDGPFAGIGDAFGDLFRR